MFLASGHIRWPLAPGSVLLLHDEHLPAVRGLAHAPGRWAWRGSGPARAAFGLQLRDLPRFGSTGIGPSSRRFSPLPLCRHMIGASGSKTFVQNFFTAEKTSNWPPCLLGQLIRLLHHGNPQIQSDYQVCQM